MTRTFYALAPLIGDGFRITVEPPHTVRFKGQLAHLNLYEVLAPYLRSVHEAALADGLMQLDVDFVELSFMSSSAIGHLVAWTAWLEELPASKRYRLRFAIDPKTAWQQKTFHVLAAMAPDRIVVKNATTRPR